MEKVWRVSIGVFGLFLLLPCSAHALEVGSARTRMAFDSTTASTCLVFRGNNEEDSEKALPHAVIAVRGGVIDLEPDPDGDPIWRRVAVSATVVRFIGRLQSDSRLRGSDHERFQYYVGLVQAL